MKQNRKIWQERQARLAESGLEYCPDFPEIAERWERWWQFDAERPIIGGTVAKDPGNPALARGKVFDLLESPDEWLAVREAQLEATYWIDSTIPSIRADIGPVCVGAFLGAPLGISEEEQTTWQTPILTGDWDGDVPELDESNRWFRIVKTLAEHTARAGAGRYLVCLPDLSGAIDVLANLRGTESLLMDLYDRPEAVKRAADAIVDGWEQSFEMIYETITSAGNGVITWLNAWSAAPHVLPTNDFNYMISEPQFREFCLPSLVEQARRGGLCAVHMDGPGAVKHLMTLAEAPEITAIQFTPGAGTPSALTWIDSWLELQEAGKPLALACPAQEIPELCRRLDKRGLLLLAQEVQSVAHARELEEIVRG